MKWIIGCAVALSVIFVAAIGAAKTIGSLSPARAAILHLTDCQYPCWLKVEPGTTDFADAIKRLEAAYSNVPDYALVTFPNTPTLVELKGRPNSPEAISPIWISFGSDDPSSAHLKYILLNFTQGGIEGQPHLADLLSLLGVPDKVILNHQLPPELDQITLQYSRKYQLQVVMFPTQDRLLFSQPINDIVWFADGTVMPPYNGKLQKWYGFTALDRYYGSSR